MNRYAALGNLSFLAQQIHAAVLPIVIQIDGCSMGSIRKLEFCGKIKTDLISKQTLINIIGQQDPGIFLFRLFSGLQQIDFFSKFDLIRFFGIIPG